MSSNLEDRLKELEEEFELTEGALQTKVEEGTVIGSPVSESSDTALSGGGPPSSTPATDSEVDQLQTDVELSEAVQELADSKTKAASQAAEPEEGLLPEEPEVEVGEEEVEETPARAIEDSIEASGASQTALDEGLSSIELELEFQKEARELILESRGSVKEVESAIRQSNKELVSAVGELRRARKKQRNFNRDLGSVKANFGANLLGSLSSLDGSGTNIFDAQVEQAQGRLDDAVQGIDNLNLAEKSLLEALKSESLVDNQSKAAAQRSELVTQFIDNSTNEFNLKLGQDKREGVIAAFKARFDTSDLTDDEVFIQAQAQAIEEDRLEQLRKVETDDAKLALDERATKVAEDRLALDSSKFSKSKNTFALADQQEALALTAIRAQRIVFRESNPKFATASDAEVDLARATEAARLDKVTESERAIIKEAQIASARATIREAEALKTLDAKTASRNIAEAEFFGGLIATAQTAEDLGGTDKTKVDVFKDLASGLIDRDTGFSILAAMENSLTPENKFSLKIAKNILTSENVTSTQKRIVAPISYESPPSRLSIYNTETFIPSGDPAFDLWRGAITNTPSLRDITTQVKKTYPKDRAAQIKAVKSWYVGASDAFNSSEVAKSLNMPSLEAQGVDSKGIEGELAKLITFSSTGRLTVQTRVFNLTEEQDINSILTLGR